MRKKITIEVEAKNISINNWRELLEKICTVDTKKVIYTIEEMDLK